MMSVYAVVDGPCASGESAGQEDEILSDVPLGNVGRVDWILHKG